jgi:hypothetical protein
MSTTTQSCAAAGRGWPLERVLFAMGGTLGLTSAVLSATVSRKFLLLTAFVGANQLLYVAVGECPASIVLQRVFGVQRRVAS